MFDGCCSNVDFSVSWHFSFIYGEPNTQLRSTMWSKKLNFRCPESIPWLVMGDLNLIGDNYDEKGKQPPLTMDRKILEELICSCSLREFAYQGPKYTWFRGNISERLDRALVNGKWNEIFPNA
ncbi:hypothetical protein SLE2022_265130 [Rubroshorea leprosula]